MKLETFFKNFDLLADAPNSVQKLRELILQLAVMGKLVPQDENDEPASVLLEKIKLEKEKLIKEGKIKKFEKLSPIKTDEIPYKLPTGWEWARFPELGEFGRGKSKHRPRNDPSLYRDGTYPLVQTGDVARANGIINTYTGLYNEKGLAQSRLWRKGTLCITIAANIADVALLGFDACFPDSVVGFIPSIEIGQADYFAYFIRTSKEYLQDYAPSTAQKNINLGILEKLLIPLPPLAEQHRIVAKVDELMALCDRLSERQQKRRSTRIIINNAAIGQLLTAREPEVFNKSWQYICNNFDLLYSTPDNIGKLRQAILQLAVQGKLVPQDENDEPASVLLEKIKFDKERLFKEGKIKKEKLLSAIQAEELEHDIPEKWNWSRLIDICELITDGTHQTPKYTKQGRMFLSAQNVKPFRFMPEVHRFVSEEDYQGYIKNRKPEFEDILLTRVGAGIGEAAVIDQKLDFAIYVSVALVRPFKKFINPYYLTIWLNSPSGTHKSSINTYGKGVSQGNLNLGLINKFIVSIPPLNEQKRIVAKVNQLMSLCDELETKLTQSVTNSEKLMEAAVRQILAANSTKTDKHESTLLETIPAETNKPETKTTRRRNKKTEGQDTEAVQLNLPLF